MLIFEKKNRSLRYFLSYTSAKTLFHDIVPRRLPCRHSRKERGGRNVNNVIKIDDDFTFNRRQFESLRHQRRLSVKSSLFA